MRHKFYRYVGIIVLSTIFLASAVFSFRPSKGGENLGSVNPAHLGEVRLPVNMVKYRDALHPNDFQSLKECAEEFKVDYRLILAIIMQESQFNHDAVSERGAVGLMQLMPVTNAEIIEDLDLEGNQLPEENIIAGTYYVSKLLSLFKDCAPEDRIRLMLASYNAGPSRIYDAQELGAYMGEDPRKWSTIEHMLPLLSKRFYSLHSSVWQSGKPRSGYFGSWRQTLGYVDNTMKIYQTFLKELI